MENNENPYEELEILSQKVVLSVRILAELKFRLNEESVARGMTLSEYSELLLANRHDRENEIEQLRAENKALRLQVVPSNDSQLELLRRENESLKQQLSAFQDQHRIFSDIRLLQLFEKLKGQKDVVENAAGDNFEIVYNTPADLLIALIYATTLNQ